MVEIQIRFGVAAGVLGEEMLDAVVVDRTREQITLTVLATQHPQLLVLLFGLDSFGNDFHAEISRERGDGANDGVVVISRKARDERTVDLEIVKWETMQVAE